MVIVLAIGKTILILLLVIACILAAVLLLPVRYEVDADLDGKRADVRVSWLLRLVRFRFHAGEQMSAVLSVLFFKIDFTSPEAKQKRAAKKAKKEAKKAAKAQRKREKKRHGGKKPEKCEDSGCQISLEENGNLTKEQAEVSSGFSKERATVGDLGGSFETKNESEFQNSDEVVNQDNFAGKAEDASGESGRETAAEKSTIKDKFSNATGAVRNAAGKAGEAKDRVTGLGKTAKRIIGLLKKYEVFEIVWPKLVRFLNRIRPRRLSGHVAFGLEDPATIGKLVGALATVPIFYETELVVAPDFETDETYVKGKIYTKGHILLVWIVALAIGLVKEKKIRRFVSDFRHGREA